MIEYSKEGRFGFAGGEIGVTEEVMEELHQRDQVNTHFCSKVRHDFCFHNFLHGLVRHLDWGRFWRAQTALAELRRTRRLSALSLAHIWLIECVDKGPKAGWRCFAYISAFDRISPFPLADLINGAASSFPLRLGDPPGVYLGR